jgi:alpha-glucosidase
MAHWFGDNYSAWDDYRFSIAEMLTFAAVHNMPMVGSDICGFNGNAQEKMCARWAMLGAFQPFYRNHADISAPSQEFYRWQLVTSAAKKAIAARYMLLDYIYLSLRRASTDGSPIVSPLFFKFPNDTNTFDVQYQWFLGEALLISPVTDDDSQSVTFYLPDDIFYDFWTFHPIRGNGSTVTLSNVSFTDIPVHIRGGTIIPMRIDSAMTTTSVRTKNFKIVIAAGLDGKAKGDFYLDDGISIDSPFTDVKMEWDGCTFSMKGVFEYQTDVVIDRVTLVTQKGVTTMTGPWSLKSNLSFKIRQNQKRSVKLLSR